MNKVFTVGDTLRLKTNIKGYEGQPLNPDKLTFNLYKVSGELVSTTEVDLVANKLSDGVFFTELTMEEGIFIFEWSAEKNGKPYVKRDTIEADFVGYW